MNELVRRLSETEQPVTVNRPNKSSKALKERIDLGYVHVYFNNTGTELCIRLHKPDCMIHQANFEDGAGMVSLEGVITLNYEKVKCKVNIDISTMEGRGILALVNEGDYERLLKAV